MRCLNPATKSLYNAEFMDEKVEFSDNGTANVPRDLGIAMVENFGVVVKYDAGEDE